MRIRSAELFVLIIFILLALGIFSLQVAGGRRYRELSDKNCVRLIAQEGSRGRILDSNSKVIAGNSISYDVMIMPQPQAEREELFLKLARVLGKDPSELRRTYTNNFLSPSLPVVAASKIELKKAIALEEIKSDLGGFTIQQRPLRDYPYGRLACHVLGYLSEIDRWRLTKLDDYGYKTKDIVGFGGIEERYDYYLRQEEGGLSIEVDHRGRTTRVLGFRPPNNGKDIQLTLDLDIQKIAEQHLEDRRGSVVILEPSSGAVLAMASRPDFSPAAFIKNTPDTSLSNIFNNPQAPLMNRAVSSSYPPASVFKLVVAAAGLNTGKLNLSDTFPCGGGIFVGKRKFACWDVHDRQNLHNAIMHSCDSYFYRAGLIEGPELIHDYAVRFGLSKPTGIELPYEASGFLPHPLWKRVYKMQKWFDGDTANFAIGQGDVLVSPLQMARMVAVFANRGYLVTPYIVQSIDGEDLSYYKKRLIKVGLKDSTLNSIRSALRDTVALPGSTAANLSSLSVEVAGKTGTAQVPHGLPHGWFAGFFPYKNPRFAICVFLENGGSGSAASGLAKQIIQDMAEQGLIEDKT